MDNQKGFNWLACCKDILLEMKQRNTEAKILPSENKVIDRILGRDLELRDAYEELYLKLGKDMQALRVFLDALVGVAAHWTPEKMKRARFLRNELYDTTQKIAKKAEELAVLIDRQTDLKNSSDFSVDTFCCPADVIEVAAIGNMLFDSYVKKEFSDLRHRYGLKYWPSMSDFIRVLARNAESANVLANDQLTAVATVSSRSSKADFFKAFLIEMELSSTKHGGFIPDELRLADRSLAMLANVAMGWDGDEMVDETYVKRLRQRERENAEL